MSRSDSSVIETKEQYEGYQRKIIGVVENKYDPTEIWRTIEALREVARAAKKAEGRPIDMAQTQDLHRKLAALPDWLAEDAGPG